MKIQTLLNTATKCGTQEDAQRLSDSMQKAFGATRALGHLGVLNAEAFMEEDTPFVRFELNHEISEHYITMIRPEIRGGKFTVVVVTNRMLDGLGLSSQSWDVVEGMDDCIEPDARASVAAVAQQAKELALANHAELIERVGVSRSVAARAARKSW